jgi:hypothetical protein
MVLFGLLEVRSERQVGRQGASKRRRGEQYQAVSQSRLFSLVTRETGVNRAMLRPFEETPYSANVRGRAGDLIAGCGRPADTTIATGVKKQ